MMKMPGKLESRRKEATIKKQAWGRNWRKDHKNEWFKKMEEALFQDKTGQWKRHCKLNQSIKEWNYDGR